VVAGEAVAGYELLEREREKRLEVWFGLCCCCLWLFLVAPCGIPLYPLQESDNATGEGTSDTLLVSRVPAPRAHMGRM